MSAYPFHPAAELLPLMSESAFAAFVDDVAQNGQLEPILVLEGQIIDGRHRIRACQALGIEPRYREIAVDGCDAIALVLSLNLHRRHLTESQRAMVAARLATMPRGRRTDLQPSANLPEVSQHDAAQALQVSERSLRLAKSVQQHGAAELVTAVEEGELAVSAASDLARLPPDTQREVLTRPPEEIRAIAAEVRQRVRGAGVCGPSALRIFDEVAAEQGLSATEQCALAEAIHADTPAAPTPAEARRIAAEGPLGLLVAATDGRFYTAPGDPEENARMERWLRLREGLEPLGTLPFSAETAFAAIPAYQRRNVTAWLAHAVPLIASLNQLWSQRHA